MTDHPLWILDVFAEHRYAGNQLAVILEAGDLDKDQMQKIAREMNFSETTFVSRNDTGETRVRIFTPTKELPFAGHPTLGTAWVVRGLDPEPRPDTLTLELGVGPIQVWFDQDMVWMRQNPPRFGETIEGSAAAEALGLHEHDIHPDLPCQVVNTGIPFLIIPIANQASLQRARPLDAVEKLTRRLDVEGVFAFTRPGHGDDGDIAGRMFSPELGVVEDPATGSANGCLVSYLSRHKVLGGTTVEARVDQGFEMGRPSRLHIRARQDDDQILVEVGGKVIPVVQGRLL